MFNFIKKWFKKEEDYTEENTTSSELFKEEKDNSGKIKSCKNCEVSDVCRLSNTGSESYLCGYVKRQKDYDPNKPSVLLFDDNYGVISFLKDDLEELDEENKINLKNYNIIEFTSKYAGFQALATLKSYSGLNIKYAIFDLTLGGGVYDEVKGNVILDGVDIFENVRYYNPDMRYIFFTGNKLNPYINKNKEIMDKFEKISGEDINKHILFKTNLTPEKRKDYLYKFIKGFRDTDNDY